MSEADAVASTEEPWTQRSLTAALTSLGVSEGSLISVHSSLSALGWTVGGAQAVVGALIDVVGASGTVVMQSHSGGNSDPAQWENPAVPKAWWPTIYADMPPYDPATTPTREMGVIVDTFRTWPGTLRSAHPATSCVALGPSAHMITSDHRFGNALGPSSPIARLVEHDALVVLLGVSHANNTILHLAEHLAQWPGKHTEQVSAAMTVDGERRWVEGEDLATDNDDFESIGDDFAVATGLERRHRTIRVAPAKAMIEFAIPWIERNRQPT